MTKPRIWLLTTAFVVAPIVGLGIALYGLGHLTVRRRTSKTDDPQTDGIVARARAEHDGNTVASGRTGAERRG